MTIEAQLLERAGSKCELCSSEQTLSVYEVKPQVLNGADACVLICDTCRSAIEAPAAADVQYWYCLRDSIWSEHAAVKVLTYRVLKSIGEHAFAQDLLGQIYLDEETQLWADAVTAGSEEGGSAEPTVDSNGTVLQTGDTVTLIKDLDVKGANFTAKRGTTVKGIALTDDPKYVEGRVNGIRIVLVAAYLKKA
jgi:protein PhnA